MGTKMAPTYATLTMGFIETQLYERFKEKYGQDEKENFMKLFKRFLDDCFLPWEKTEAELEELNSQNVIQKYSSRWNMTITNYHFWI